MSKHIIVYSARLCGDCQHLKTYMDKAGMPYETRDIHEDPRHAEELEARTGKLGVPYLVVNGDWRRGYDPGKPFSEEFAASVLT